MERLGKIGHWRWDIKNNSLFWSQGVYDIHGIDFEGYQPDVDAALDAYVTEDRGDVEELLTRAIENKEDFKFEKRIKRPNGEIRHVIAQGECEFCPENGELISVFGVIQDITPIKQQEELYELSALGSNSALWDWHIETDELRWAGRSAQVLGYTLNSNLPQTTKHFFTDFLHEDDQEKLRNSFVNHFTKLDDFRVEIRIKRQDGSYEWFLSCAQSQFDDYGKAIRVCGSMTSIQELKEAQTKLEASNKDLENFACIAAHEIKSPIRSIGSYLELIRMEETDLNKKTADYINTSIEITNQTSYMIDELLEYASLQDAELKIEETNLEKMTKLIVREMKQEVKDSGAKISFKNFIDVQCDETKIKTVISNLIQNALKYRSEATPQIDISMQDNNDHWQFSVKDNGIGMPDKQASMIFEMFKRLDNAHAFEGTGIGLAICERIISLHDGKIWAESQQGTGSTFHFTISKHLNKKRQ